MRKPLKYYAVVARFCDDVVGTLGSYDNIDAARAHLAWRRQHPGEGDEFLDISVEERCVPELKSEFIPPQ